MQIAELRSTTTIYFCSFWPLTADPHTQDALSHATQRHNFFPITQTPCSSAQSVLSLSKLLFRTFIFPSLKWLDVAVEQEGYFPQGQCDFSLITNQQKKAWTWLSTQQPNIPPNMNSRLPGSCISAMQRRLCCLSTFTSSLSLMWRWFINIICILKPNKMIKIMKETLPFRAGCAWQFLNR